MTGAGPRRSAGTGAGPRVSLTISARHARAAQAGRVLRAAGREFAKALRLGQREVSLALVSDAAIRELNRAWRGKDRATDVLSFPQEESALAGAGGARATGPLGDVIISLPAALRQARAGGWSLTRELRRLLAHGLLHCLGHDHEEPSQARSMARAERRLLGAEGMVGDSLSAPR